MHLFLLLRHGSSGSVVREQYVGFESLQVPEFLWIHSLSPDEPYVIIIFPNAVYKKMSVFSVPGREVQEKVEVLHAEAVNSQYVYMRLYIKSIDTLHAYACTCYTCYITCYVSFQLYMCLSTAVQARIHDMVLFQLPSCTCAAWVTCAHVCHSSWDMCGDVTTTGEIHFTD